MSSKASWAAETKKVGVFLLWGASGMKYISWGRGVGPAQIFHELILMQLWLAASRGRAMYLYGTLHFLDVFPLLEAAETPGRIGVSAGSLQKLKKIWIFLVQCLTSISLLSSDFIFKCFYMNLYLFRNLLHHLKAVNFLSSVWIWLFERH